MMSFAKKNGRKTGRCLDRHPRSFSWEETPGTHQPTGEEWGRAPDNRDMERGGLRFKIGQR